MRHGRGFPIPAVVRARPVGVVASLTLAITKGALTLSGKTLTYSSGAVVTKVVVNPVVQRWNAANWINQTSVCYSVQRINMGTNALGLVLASGTNGTTNGSGVFSIATTNAAAFIGDTVVVTLWKQGAGPASQNIIGSSFETLVAGP